MRIAFVNNNYQYGGAERVVQQLHSACRKAGHRSRLYVDRLHLYGWSHFPWGQAVRPLYPLVLQRFWWHPRLGPRIRARFPRAQWTDRRFRALARTRADLVHVHSFHGDYATVQSLAHVAERRIAIWTFHGYWGITGGCVNPYGCRRYNNACGSCPQVGGWNVGPVDRTADELERKLRLLAPLPLHIIVPSRHMAKTVRESRVGGRWTVHHIPNGVDPGQFGFTRKGEPAFRASLGFDPHATVVLVVNRDFRDVPKGFPVIARALSCIDPRGVQVVLVGHHADWAARQITARMPCHAVGYAEDRSRLAALHEAGDIVLFASAGENFPCAILEAMAAQCCVVSTPTDGVLEQIENGRSGIIATDLSSESLGTALAGALAHPDSARAYGKTARERVVTLFTEERMITRHLRLYASLVARRGKTPRRDFGSES